MANERINSLEMTTFDMVYKMSGGNPGAITVLMQLLQSSDIGFFKILFLDTLNIWDHYIWMFYKDCCGEDINLMMRVMDDCQQGFISDAEVVRHVHNSIPFKYTESGLYVA